MIVFLFLFLFFSIWRGEAGLETRPFILVSYALKDRQYTHGPHMLDIHVDEEQVEIYIIAIG